MSVRIWFLKTFDTSRPRHFLRNLAWTSVLLTVLPLPLLVLEQSASNDQRGTPLAYISAVAIVVVPLIWSLYATVIVALIASRIPAPTPLGSRNLLLSTASWLTRLFWGSSVLVLGGFIGGFVAQQLDSINTRYVEAQTSESVQTYPLMSNAAVDANIALVNVVYGWVALIVILSTVVVLLIFPFWVSIKLLLAGRDKRLLALAQLLKFDFDGEHENTTRKSAWLSHLAGWLYPLSFLVVASFVGAIVSLLLALGIDSAHVAIIDALNSLRPA